MGWQWPQLDHMQVICTSLQTDNHASTSQLSFYSLIKLVQLKNKITVDQFVWSLTIVPSVL